MMPNTVSPIYAASNGSHADGTSSRGWKIFLVLYGLWVWLPWLAPVLMHAGLDPAARIIYFVYSFFCHQLPERSFFLFGQKAMVSLAEIQAAGQNTLQPLLLRKFIGNSGMGWKVAWSDRMVSFYSTIWLFALVWWPFRRKIKPLPVWGLILLWLPIAIDGGTHWISDLAGIEQGFRENNLWLAALTHHALPASFYMGNALGSFNSWMRLLTGPVAGLGMVWFALPHIFQAQALDPELEKINYGKAFEQIQNGHPDSTG